MTTTGGDDLCYMTATELARAFHSHTTSPVELVTALLDRIERLNPKVNAFVTLLGEQALAQAEAAERRLMSGETVGPLCGLPVMVKDLTPTAGVRTTFGSCHYSEYVPEEDAPIWARLKAADAILLGKTTTPEFGEHSITESPLTGVTNNPWDLSRTVGGSSGGSAAALAAGFGPLATGSDGGGSIRVPSAFCGVVGLKPSPGRVPLGPEGSPYDTVSVVGPMTRTVADTALLLTAVAGPDPYNPVSLPEQGVDYLALLENASVKGLRIALSQDLGNPPIESGVSAALERAAEAFERELEAEVEEVDLQLPDPFDYFVHWWAPQIALEFDEFVTSIGADPSGSHPLFQEVVAEGRAMSAVEYAQVQYRQRASIHKAFAEVFADYDLLLMPTTPMAAFPHPGPEGGPLEVAGRSSKYPALENQRCTEAIAHAGYPAITVPCGFTQEGLPVGLQIAAGHGCDADVLRAAAAFERATPWQSRRPLL